MRLLAETQETRQYFRQPVEEQGWLWFLPQLRSPNKINIEPYKINIESASCNISHISSKMKTSTFFQVFKMRKPWLWLLERPRPQPPWHAGVAVEAGRLSCKKTPQNKVIVQCTNIYRWLKKSFSLEKERPQRALDIMPFLVCAIFLIS